MRFAGSDSDKLLHNNPTVSSVVYKDVKFSPCET